MISYYIIPYLFISFHIISYHVIPYLFISFHIISYHVIPYLFISFHIISYHIIPYLFTSFHIISYHVSYDIISYHQWILDASLHELYCKVLITVPLRALLDQFAADFPGFCKVGTRHNKKIDFNANGFHCCQLSPCTLLQKLKFNTILVDEAHHPLPKKLPKAKELFQFSATLEEEKGIDFQYTMGKAIEDGVLCDYDITVPAVTAHHAYVCLADLLLKQAGRFRRVLAYCNTVAEAKRFQMVLEELGLGCLAHQRKDRMEREEKGDG